MSELANQSIIFEVEGLAKNTLVVTNLAGTEAISNLWGFSLSLVSRDANLDLEKILYSPVKLGLKQGIIAGGERAVRTRWFAGILSHVEQREQGQGWTTYSAMMVPKLHQTTEFWRSRIFMDKNVEDLITDVLTGDPGIASDEFELNLKRGSGGGPEAPCYPTHEYVVQYEESDFSFLSRWLEHEGVFYFFDNGGEKEELIFADSTASYRDSRETIPYRPSSQSGSAEGGENTLYEEEVVRAFSALVSRQPKRVILKDYNWRTPEVELSIEKGVNPEGLGMQVQYNDHFKTEEQGKSLSIVRSEEFASREQVYLASTNCKSLRPGKTFKMTEHFRGTYNTVYLVTHVEHVAEQAVDLDAGRVSSGSYSNSLTLIAADVSFRPARETAWPTIKGLIHAKIDAPETEGEYAEIDDYGRYRVRFPYDGNLDKHNENRTDEGPRSRYVRMIQPYAGRDSGMHFPLLKGTEVMISHIDGDPDRPVIVGAVPNPDTMSPVTANNYMSNKIVTTSGNVMEMDDNPDCPGFLKYDATRSTIEDTRFPTSGGGGGGGSSPSGGSGGVQLPASVQAAKRAAQAKRAPRRAPAAAAPAAGSGGVQLPSSAQAAKRAVQQQNESKQRPARPRAQGQPGAGAGAVVPPATPPTEFNAFNEFVNGAAFQQAGNDGAQIAGLPLNEGNLKRALNTLLRKHLTQGSSPAGAASMSELMGGMGNEMVDMIATPFGLGSPDSGAVDGYLGDLASGGKQKYSVGSELLQISIGDTAKVFIGSAKYVFDDVSNSVSFGTGGYGYSRTDGDSFSESYQYGADCSVSINYGAKESFSMAMNTSKSTSLEMSTTESHSVVIGTKTSTDTFLGGTNSTSFELAIKNSNSMYLAAITSIDIYASAKLALELSASALLEIKIVAAKEKKITIPGEDKITIDDLVLRINKNENNLALTSNQLMKTQNNLAETNNKLTETENKLAQTETKLADTQTKLSESTTALSKEQKTLSNSQTSAITTIQ